MKQPFKSFRIGNHRIAGIMFACLFAGLGTMLILASHADNTGDVMLITKNTAGQNLNGVQVDTSTQNPGQHCLPVSAVSDPVVSFSCGSSAVSITGISLAGYHVCGCSAVQVGTSWNNPNTQPVQAVITMESNTPPPTPTPTPTPTPSPPTSGGGTTHSGGTTTTHTSSGSTVKVSPSTSSSGSTDTTSNVQPATNATGDSLSDGGGTVNVYQTADTTIKSADNLAKVTFPAGTFDGDAYCSIDATESVGMPAKAGDAIGPYSIDCTDNTGSPLTKFKYSVNVNISLPSKSKTYMAYENDGSWKLAATETGGSSIKFKLAKDVVFGASPKATTNWAVIIIDIFLVLLAIGVLIFIVRLIRNRQVADTPPPAYYE